MRVLLWIGALLPILYALIRFGAPWQPHWLYDILGFIDAYLHMNLTTAPADPLKFLMHLSGLSALWLLVLTLTLTPLRVYLSLNLLKHRRFLGLFTFFYAFIHFLLFVGVDQQFDLHGIGHEIVTKPFIAFGMGAFAIVTLMAMTSTKKLFASFRAWHKLVYIAVVLIALHYLLGHKTITLHHIAVVGILFLLLALRLLKR